MKRHLLYFSCLLFLASAFSSCFNYRRLITDEVVLKDNNSITGTIRTCDSANVRIKKIDESMVNIPWSDIDTIQGKKLKTFFCGINFGYYKTPFFSVFRNESFIRRSGGMQMKAGFAFRGNQLGYLHITPIFGPNPSLVKLGFGFQQYLGNSNYYKKKNNFFIGMEANLISIENNNGPQFTFEPYTGFERKLNERIRIHVKFQPQFNFANKNNASGLSFTLGCHFMNRNFARYYKTLNEEHHLLRK